MTGTGTSGPARVLVLAGPSGGGKSRIARRLALPTVPLDDFYLDEDDPRLPRVAGRPDWESPRAWDRDAALRALDALCRTGRTTVPDYSFTLNRATGEREVRLDGSAWCVAEGLFAAEVVPALREAGLLGAAVVLANPRGRTLLRRLVRDVADRRKPLPTILRLGWAKYRSDPGIVGALVAAGLVPMTNTVAESYLRGMVGRRADRPAGAAP